MAARPKTLPAAAAPVLIGSGLAASHGSFAALPAAAALLGALLIQIATNFANDYSDFVRGTDTVDRVGPQRVTQAGLVSQGEIRTAVGVAMTSAFVVGIYLVWVGGWPIAVIGIASLVCAVIYTGGPYPLGYLGLGDVFVFVFFGLVAVGGTYWVQAATLPVDALVAGAGVGSLSTAILVVNNLRDLRTDAAVGKRTLAVRLGARGSKVEYLALLVVGFGAPVVGVLWLGWSRAALLTLLVAPLVWPPLQTVLRHQSPEELLPSLGQTARVVALYAVALSVALAWGSVP